MKRIILLMPVLVVLLGMTLSAKTELPENLTVELDRKVVNLYDTVTGKVQGLGPGEKFTVDLVDAYGRVTARSQLKRKGFEGTPFRLQIRWFSTSTLTVRAKGASEREGSAQLHCIPPTHGWETFLLVTADISVVRSIERCNVLRLLGFQTGAASDLASIAGFSNCNFRSVALAPSAQDAFVVGDGTVQTAIRDHEERTDKNDYSALARDPCLSKPNVSATTLTNLGQRIGTLSTHNPVGYVLFDAPGITPNNRAVDFCFDPQTLSDFRDWLKQKYPSVGALSRGWAEKFRRWEDVVPMTTPEILQREHGKYKRRKSWNFAPWVDHRAFMDEKFGTLLASVGEQLRLTHRGVRTGFLGGLEPAAFGGYDWTYAARAMDFAECTGETFKRLAASLNRQRVHPGYMMGTVSDKTGPGEFVRRLWTNVANGDLGVVIEPGMSLLDGRGLPTALAYKARPSLLALEGLGHVIVDKEFAPRDTGVYLYYSQPSVRVQYMLDAGALGETFRLGVPADDPWTSTWHRNLRAWTDLLDDLGIEFGCLSYRKVHERGWTRGVKVVILPKVVALTKTEAQALRQFVERGGMLIADSQTGIFDEHGVEQEKPALDSLFSIKREDTKTAELAAKYSELVKQPLRLHRERGRFKDLAAGVPLEHLRPVEPQLAPLNADYHLSTGRTHAVLTRTLGRGNAIYLNLSLMNYPWERAEPKKVAGLRELTNRILAAADVRPAAVPVKVAKAELPDLAIRQFRHRKNDYLIVLRRGAPPEAPPPPVVEPLPEELPPLEPIEELPPPPPPVLPEPPPAPPAAGPPAVQFLQAAAPAPETEAPAKEPLLKTADADHRAKAGDVLGVQVRGRPDLTSAAVVGPDGKVTLKLVGDVEVAGLTAAEIDAKLTKTYRDRIAGVEVTVRLATPLPKGDEEKPKEPVMKGDFFTIKLDRERYVYDVLIGRALGHTAEPAIFLPEDQCTVLALLDYEVKTVDVSLTQRPEELTYRIKLSTTGTPGLHAFRVQFIDPKGRPVDHYGTTLPARAGYAGGVFHLGIGEMPGEWTIRVTDILTGTRGEAKFTLK